MRSCYLLSGNPDAPRTQSSKEVLERIGFQVNLFHYIPHENPILSNKISFLQLYELILQGEQEWGYVFEDDVNILESITLDEIVRYENISTHMFYLGACIIDDALEVQYSSDKVNDHAVALVQGNVRGAHAVALKKKAIVELLDLTKTVETDYCDVVLEEFTKLHPAPLVRRDLKSYIEGHRGIVFQDRNSFPSIIETILSKEEETVVNAPEPDVL